MATIAERVAVRTAELTELAKRVGLEVVERVTTGELLLAACAEVVAEGMETGGVAQRELQAQLQRTVELLIPPPEPVGCGGSEKPEGWAADPSNSGGMGETSSAGTR